MRRTNYVQKWLLTTSLLVVALCASPLNLVDGVYQISTAEELKAFAEIVNNGQYDANAVLTADIDMKGIAYTPIGWNIATNNSSANSSGALYCGHFDGQGHRISNLVVNKPGSVGVGLFGDITGPAHIENFVLESSCEIHGKDRAGVIGRADANGRSGDARVVTINNVGNEGNVYADTAPAGILGNANTGSVAIITNCYSSGLITMETESLIGNSDHNAALICGWLGNVGAKITNCWSTAEITNYQNTERAFCRVGGDTNVFINNYSTFAAKQTWVVPEDAFITGEVTHKLNNGAITGGIVWYQTIGEDKCPTFNFTHGIVNEIDDSGYASQYIAESDVLVPEGVTAFTGFIDTPWIALREVQNVIPAATAVVLQGAKGYYSFIPISQTILDVNLGTTNIYTGSASLECLEGTSNPMNYKVVGKGTAMLQTSVNVSSFDNLTTLTIQGTTVGDVTLDKLTIWKLESEQRNSTQYSLYIGESSSIEGHFTYNGNTFEASNLFIDNATSFSASEITLNMTIYYGSDMTEAVNMVYTGKADGTVVEIADNDLKGTAESLVADGTQYVLTEKNGVIGFYQAQAGTTIPAGKAYIEYAGAGVKGFFFDGTDGIEQITPASSPEESGAAYDLAGRRVEKPVKGMYIINGKKILK